MFRHGYRKDFPSKLEIGTTGLKRGMEKDQKQRRERAEKMKASTHRSKNIIEVGDKVYARNMKRSKFQPIFNPTLATVIEVENGGVTCQTPSGETFRRHHDDIKHGKEEEWWVQEGEETCKNGARGESAS